jgi:hypothetical protein
VKLLPESDKRDWLTIALVGATIAIAVFSFLLWVATQEMTDINRQLTKITEEHYEYHPPNVSVISGMVLELYVYRNESNGTYLTIAGLSKFYNSGVADDYGVVRPKHWGLSPKTESEVKLMYSLLLDENLTLEVTGVREIDTYRFVECPGVPIPVSPGGPVEEIPLFENFITKDTLNLNTTINLTTRNCPLFEVIHPISKEVISNISALENNNISYVMGAKKANAELIDGRKVDIAAYYTEDFNTYERWKKEFLRRHNATGPIVRGIISW